MMGKKRIVSIILVIFLVMSFVSNVFFSESIIKIVRSSDDSDDLNEETTLNVTVLHKEPRINWYDLQFNNSGTWESRLNQQIIVNNSAQYRFIVNISSDYGWENISYINITAWNDNGSEATTYNQTSGGNINLHLQYENTTGTADWSLIWPTTGEVTFNQEESYETVEVDPYGIPGHTECYNVTFAFTPGYQFRYAPGSAIWNTTEGFNDLWSWNFNITIDGYENKKSYNNPAVGESVNEFGVYAYTEIVSVGWPTITGSPGDTEIADTNITILTRSNGNYTLNVDLDQLDHDTHPTANMSNTTVSLRGGNLSAPQAFGAGFVYLWGTDAPTYQAAENTGTSKTTNDLEYRIAIPMGQIAGNYRGTLRYRLTTETT